MRKPTHFTDERERERKTHHSLGTTFTPTVFLNPVTDSPLRQEAKLDSKS